MQEMVLNSNLEELLSLTRWGLFLIMVVSGIGSMVLSRINHLASQVISFFFFVIAAVSLVTWVTDYIPEEYDKIVNAQLKKYEISTNFGGVNFYKKPEHLSFGEDVLVTKSWNREYLGRLECGKKVKECIEIINSEHYSYELNKIMNLEKSTNQ